MKTFKDMAGRDWSVVINFNSVQRVRDLAGVNLLDTMGAALAEKLTTDPMIVVQILYAIVKPEADKASVSFEAFGDAMGGDSIDAATNALIDELISFFPKSRRPVLQKAMAKMAEVETAAMAQAAKALDAIDAATIATSASGSASTNSPALSASIPAH